ncbi:MAG: hypothetical protein JNL47_08115 [Bacteroidia bacterium]|nr:hypothetical protein [Bacteroidia bacterium]
MICNAAFAQSTTPGNVWVLGGNEFLGWDLTPTNITPLFIKHELNQPIRFFTDAANGVGLFNNQRMIIDVNPGHIGIGLNHMPGNDILDILPDAGIPEYRYWHKP